MTLGHPGAISIHDLVDFREGCLGLLLAVIEIGREIETREIVIGFEFERLAIGGFSICPVARST
jgi:hypothetical protein